MYSFFIKYPYLITLELQMIDFIVKGGGIKLSDENEIDSNRVKKVSRSIMNLRLKISKINENFQKFLRKVLKLFKLFGTQEFVHKLCYID